MANSRPLSEVVSERLKEGEEKQAERKRQAARDAEESRKSLTSDEPKTADEMAKKSYRGEN